MPKSNLNLLEDADTGNREMPQKGSSGAAHTKNVVIHTSYQGLNTIGTTPVYFVFAPGAVGVKIRVTHATQTIKIGMGADQTEADARALLSISYDISDKFIEEYKGELIKGFSLVGSGVGTTVELVQI